MFETDRIIFLQLQKSACTHIAQLLDKTVGGRQVKPKHSWLTDYSSEKMIMGSIRNPWDWYVSLWAYGSNDKGGLYDRLTKKSTGLGLRRIGKGAISHGMHELRKPVGEWSSVYGDSMDASKFRKWLRMVMDPRHHRDLGERYHESATSGFAGFMTYRYCKLFLKDFFDDDVFTGIHSLQKLQEYDEEHCLIDLLVRVESLEEDLIEAMEKSGHELTDEMKSTIREGSRKKVNRSERHSVSHYYDSDTIDLVRRAEEFIIHKYGYEPPSVE